MSDYIDREKAIDAVLHCFFDGKESMREIMESIPSADVAPVVHAKWNVLPTNFETVALNCMNCGMTYEFIDKYFVVKKYCFCPYCGAKMDF